MIGQLLTQEVVQAVGAVLAMLILAGGAWLAKLAKDKLGVEVDTARLQALSAAAEQGVLLAAQQHRHDAARGLRDGQVLNAAMHKTAVIHVQTVAARAAKKAGSRVGDAAVHAAVRRLKGLL